MPRWNEGAITDIPARSRFQHEITPIWLTTACTLLGARAPAIDRPFRYADLGCGAGLTAQVVAASCPGGEVWGFDLNPANIEAARGLAEQAGLTNVRFVETSFAAMLERDLPEFDFIVAEGVLSTISPDQQALVCRLIDRLLRPGGLACLGYAAEAGWSEFVPAQMVMRMLYQARTEASDFAVETILPYLDRLRAGGSLYFQRNPNLEARIEELRHRPAGDVAHEFLGQEWQPLSFANVADAMAEAKCDFIGRATPHENIPAAAVPAAMVPLLEAAPSLRIRETMQDVAAATAWRRDIFRRGASFPPVAEHRARLAALTVTALNPISPDAAEFPGHGDHAPYRPLLARLRAGPLSLGEIQTLDGFAACPIEAAADAVAVLLSAGYAHPLMPAAVMREAAAAVGRLNAAIIDAVTRGEAFEYLVSPVVGSAISANAWEILTVGALIGGGDPNDLTDVTARVLPALRTGGRAVVRDGAPVEDNDTAIAILREVIAGIIEHRLPVWRTLGVLPG